MNWTELSAAFTARAYEPTCVRLFGGGRITHCAFRYDAYAISCWRAWGSGRVRGSGAAPGRSDCGGVRVLVAMQGA